MNERRIRAVMETIYCLYAFYVFVAYSMGMVERTTLAGMILVVLWSFLAE